MSNEIYAYFDEGNDLYALIFRKSDNKVWNELSNAFETYTDADIDEYDVPLANIVDSDYYSVDFPADITDTATQAYRVQVMLRPGAIDADADFTVGSLEIQWNGEKEIDLGIVFGSNQSVTNFYDDSVTTNTGGNPQIITIEI